jgi:alkylation response protein AidB-like acyl-CoA dehydrogenase
MLDLARTHALERVQFERPIARFQAVRHRLAEALVAVEALDATLAAAADDPGTETAALAKAVAGRAAATVAGHAQQVLAGIGFTTDHPLHRYARRTIVLDGLYGGATDVTLDLGRRLLAGGRVPTLIEL